jgi:hypothetical protein
MKKCLNTCRLGHFDGGQQIYSQKVDVRATMDIVQQGNLEAAGMLQRKFFLND